MWKVALLCLLLTGCATTQGTYLSPEDEAALVQYFNALKAENERLRARLQRGQI